MGATERDLVYRIRVAGGDEARSAIRSVVAEANRQAQEEIRAARNVAQGVAAARRAGSSTSRRIIDEEAAYAARVGKVNIAIEKNNARERVKDAKEVQKAKEKAEADTSKFLFSEWRKRQQEEKRISDQRVRDAKKEADEIARFKMKAEENTSRHIMAERTRAQRQAERDAKLFARDRAFEDRRLYRGIAGGLHQGVSNIMSGAYGIASRGAGAVVGGMGLRRAYDVQDIVSERAMVNHALRSVAIEARTAGGDFNFDERAARRKIADVAKRTGFSQTELVGAIDAYSEKGSGATGVRDLDKIAMQARAMGADPSTIAKLRANLELKVKAGLPSGTKPEDADKIASQFSDRFMARMHFTGKTGVFRASDLAAQSEMMLASFGPDIMKGADKFLGFANEVRKSTGSGAMARTAFDSALDVIDKKRDKIRALGVNTEDENDDPRNKVDVIMDIIAATKGDRSRLSKIFDPSRGGKAVTTLIDAFNAAGGGDAGRGAMEKLLAGDASLAKGDMGEMMKDANAALDDESVKLATNVENVRQTISETLEPALVKLAKAMPDLVSGFGSLVDFVKKNPWLAAGTIASAGGSLGMGGGLARVAGRSALEWLGGRLVNTVPGAAGKVLGGGAGILGNIVGNVGATPVMVTNWPANLGGGTPGEGTVEGVKNALGKAAPGSSAAQTLLGAPATAAISAMLGSVVLGMAVDGAIEQDKLHERVMSKGYYNDVVLKRAAENEAKPGYEAANKATLVDIAAGEATHGRKPKAMVGSAVARDLGPSSATAAAYAPGAPAFVAPKGNVQFRNDKDHLMGNLAEKLAATAKALDELEKKARSTTAGLSLLKANPTL